MAQAMFRVPPILREFPQAVELSAISAQQSVGAAVELEAIQNAPANTGALRQSLKWTVRKEAGLVRGRLVTVNPQVAPYADVMDKGRRPGARGPHSRHLTRWVELKMPAAIQGLAAEITARRNKSNRKRTSTKSATVQARDSLAFLVARKIHRDGIKGRKFAPPVERVGRDVLSELRKELSRRARAAERLRGPNQ